MGGDTLTGGRGTNNLILATAGTVNLSGVSGFTIDLDAGNNTVTVTDTTLSGGPVGIFDGGTGTTTISANGTLDTKASKGKTLVYFAGTGTDSLTGGFENDTVFVSATAVGGDTFIGGSGTNTLVLTTAGTVNLGGVKDFGNIDLAAANNSVSLTDTTLSGGTVTLFDGASGNNTVVASDTTASTGKTLTHFTGSGTDSFAGGFANDTLFVSATAVGGDTLTGGSGANTLDMTTVGAVNLGRVSNFGKIDLAGGGTNTVTVTDTTLSGGTIAIFDGTNSNNTVSAAGDTAASKGKTLVYFENSGTDSFAGGFENDIIVAGAAMSSSDSFVFIADNLGTQTIDNFRPSTDSLLVYGIHAANGFDLGPTDNGLNPLSPTAIDPTIFIANAAGTFTSSSQRFAYDTTNGDLVYGASGSMGPERTIAIFNGATSLTADNILFEH